MTERVIPIRPEAARPASPAPRYDGAPLADTRGRALRDLRISVTDRCNFRCVYCMPREVFGADYKFLPHAAILSFEEIARLARVFVGLGVKKIRLTGGEPLVRKDLYRLIAMLAELPIDLTLTPNGSLLARQAKALKEAGLVFLRNLADLLSPRPSSPLLLSSPPGRFWPDVFACRATPGRWSSPTPRRGSCRRCRSS